MTFESSVVAPRLACKADLSTDAEQPLTREIIAAAIEVHRSLGPGLLESAYQACLCRELELRKIAFRQQVEILITYKGVKLDGVYRIDWIVSDRVFLELRSVKEVLRVHGA